eukprot:IDg14225t1
MRRFVDPPFLPFFESCTHSHSTAGLKRDTRSSPSAFYTATTRALCSLGEHSVAFYSTLVRSSFEPRPIERQFNKRRRNPILVGDCSEGRHVDGRLGSQQTSVQRKLQIVADLWIRVRIYQLLHLFSSMRVTDRQMARMLINDVLSNTRQLTLCAQTFQNRRSVIVALFFSHAVTTRLATNNLRLMQDAAHDWLTRPEPPDHIMRLPRFDDSSNVQQISEVRCVLIQVRAVQLNDSNSARS